MYVASTRSPGRTPKVSGRLPGTVFALGTVSLLTDISAEMVTAFLPVYLIYTLQMSYVQFGLLDGLYTGATAVLRLVGGYVSDRTSRPKLVALFGYGLSAVTKLVFPMVGASSFGIGGVLATDRAGKGIRTAPRDALISLATPSDQLGAAFGVHRAMDTVGALCGPLLTFLILSQIGTAAGPVFVVSFVFAAIGVVVLLAFVRERRSRVNRSKVSVKAGMGLLRDAKFRRATIAAALLGLVTISDAFVFVVLQKVSDIPVGFLPLLPLGTAAVFLLGAAPIGRMADRFGRWKVFFAGHVLLLVTYGMLLVPDGGFLAVAIALAAHGLFYACTDGVLSAYASGFVPADLRATGLATIQTGQALTRMVSSVVFGVMLAGMAMSSAVIALVAVLIAALIAVALLVRSS
ncbi:MFS transporter [Kibdelosporangium phytohabitans]|uniref:MFS transporter n=1 Tax=Kibdelosporangium phytohabitans TaxID=860235 RepID=A0A0N9IF56_9PSEU|nr:MFS transporter [Kibdelosporangium phytohabitans]ALG14076.1 MFS transporter [Kibdelosporangium phytohabitans]MBE1466952.1 MFS family permease [Kibdelosporangium phytohabitans]